jgi:poly-gamma-glutamate capsule biosynthesis protein CapA/YwtB (metallophosphatase superfamily)
VLARTSVELRAPAAGARSAVRQPSAAAGASSPPATPAGRATASAEARPPAEPSRRVAAPRPPSPRGFTLLASGDVLPHGSVQERARGYGAVLDRAGLRHAGTARSRREARPRILTVRHVRVALLSYTYGLNGFRLPRGRPWLVNLLSPGRILADARAARRAGSQFTVVFLHWGQEYRSRPTPAQRALARKLLADPGVDLIVGHHAHVVQPIRRVNGKWVAFGMGNSLSAQSAACCPAATQDGVLVKVTVVHKAGRMVVGRLSYIPTWVERPSYRVLPVGRALARRSASPATRAMLRASLRRTTTAVGRAVRS